MTAVPGLDLDRAWHGPRSACACTSEPGDDAQAVDLAELLLEIVRQGSDPRCAALEQALMQHFAEGRRPLAEHLGMQPGQGKRLAQLMLHRRLREMTAEMQSPTAWGKAAALGDLIRAGHEETLVLRGYGVKVPSSTAQLYRVFRGG